MGESALSIPDPLGGEPDFESALFHRRIEFQLATRPFNGFGSGNSGGFKLVTLNPNAETNKGAGAGSAQNREKIELFEAGFDPDLSFRITFRRIGAGLRNLGNTCFLNAVLQCLTYTEPLAAYLQSGKHQSSCRKAGFCALCAIQKHVSRALQSTGRILEPKDLVSNLRCISRSFRNARQEDAHEYMVNLLESMHKCCLPSGVPSESPSAYEKSLVHRIFGGRLRSQVKCMQCSFCSNKFDPFLDLSLEIVKADSLIKALAHFTAKEHLDGGAKVYQCDHCKQKVKAIKQLSVHKAPHVLTIHLKRFSSHLEGQKIVKKVAFGPTLNMRPFVTGPYDGDLNYTLYGVLVHAGWSTHSGHYYCYVRTSSGMWYSLDDNQVIQVNERTVLDQKAYMLFYVRDRTTFSKKKSVDSVKKENMVLNAFGGAASSKFNVDFTGKIQNVSIEKKPGEAFPASMAPTVQVLSSPSTKELSVDVNVPVADSKDLDHGPHAEHSSGTPLAENNLKDHSLLPSIGNVQVPPMENDLMHYSSLPNRSVNGEVTPVVDNLKDHSSLPNRNANGQVTPRENNLMDQSSLANSSGNGRVPPREDNLMGHSSQSNSSGNGQVPPRENNLMNHSSLLKSSGNGQVPPTENTVKYHSSLPKSSGRGQVPPTENTVKDHSSLRKNSGKGQVPPTENTVKYHSSLPKNSGNGQVPPTENTVKYHSSLPKSSGNGQVPPKENNMMDRSSLPNRSANGRVTPRENTLMDRSSLSNSSGNGRVSPRENNLIDHSSQSNSSGNGQVPRENNLKDHSSLPKSSGNGQVPPTENTVKDHSSLPKSSGNGQVLPAENNMKDYSSLLKSSRSVQVGGPSGNTAADSTLLETHEHGIHGSQNVACGVKTNKKTRLKVRRKLLKYHIAANSLSSVMMFSAVLRTEKKNRKLRKRHSMQKKDLNRKVLLARSGFRANSESSVSESSLPTVVGYAPSQKKNAESCSVGNNQSLNLHAVTEDGINGSMNPEFKGRTIPDDPSILAENPTVLPCAARRSPCGTTFSAENPAFLLESRQANAMSRLTRGLPEAEVMSMLTRDKTIVAHWDGIDVSPVEQVETPAAGPLQLGYIGDEWDEDYDRGKRKKVRDPKPEFDGRNFFQEHTTRNHQMKRAKTNQTRNLGMKRAKVNRSCSENDPFRI